MESLSALQDLSVGNPLMDKVLQGGGGGVEYAGEQTVKLRTHWRFCTFENLQHIYKFMINTFQRLEFLTPMLASSRWVYIQLVCNSRPNFYRFQIVVINP